MIRFVLLLAALLLAVWLALRLVRQLQEGNIDWRGVAFGAGFIGLAFYLSHVTGIAGLPT